MIPTKLLLSLCAILSVIPCMAQSQLRALTNMMRNGDQLYRQEIEYFNPGEAGPNQVWDLSSIEQMEERELLTFHCDTDSTSYQYYEPSIIHKYSFRHDSLLYLGYESGLQKLEYVQPLFHYHYPYSYGEKYTQVFQGLGEYCRKYKLESNGIMEAEADATGSIVLNSGDTLKHVMRVHRIYSSAISQHLPDEDIDSLNLKQRIEEHYLWYALGYRYPVLESVSLTIFNNLTPVACLQRAYSTLNTDQRLLEDEANEQILDSLATSNQIIKEPRIEYEVVVEGGVIKVLYTALQDIHIQGIISDRMGMVYQRETASSSQGEYATLQFNTNLKRGVYILYLNVNGEIFTEKLEIK